MATKTLFSKSPDSKSKTEKLEREIAQLKARNRKQLKQISSLLEKDAHYSQLLQTARIGMWSYDLASESLTWSDEHFHILGLSPTKNSPTLALWESYLHPDELTHMRELLKKCHPRRPSFTGDYRVLLPSGEVRYCRTKGHFIFQNGKATQAHGTTQDITDIKIVEQRYQQALKDADEANKAKSEFLARMSHELRTPLNAIISPIELLRGEKKSSVRKELLDMMSSSGQSLLRLIDDVLSLSSMETGKIQFEMTTVDLRKLVNDTMNQFSGLAISRGINLSYEVSSFAPTFIRTDAARLRQILSNLISNSLKFTPKGSIKLKVDARVLTHMDEWHIQFIISDTGIGIDAKDQGKLFAPFTQIDPSHTRKYGGTGLGLAICKELCHMMGGDIYFTSKPNEGTTFCFFITTKLASPEESVDNKEHLDLENFATRHPMRVAIAEDNLTNLRIIQIMLTRLGYSEFLIVRDGQELLDALRGGQEVDVILMDQKMPRLDGIATAKTIRANAEGDLPQHAYIISLTANAPKHDYNSIYESGMNDFLCKPVLLETLAGSLARAHTHIQNLAKQSVHSST